MKKAIFCNKKNSLLIFSLVILIAVPGFSMFVGNASPIAFDDLIGNNSISSVASTESINALVIKSASYFLKGKSDVDLLSARLEASELETVYLSEIQKICASALENLKAAHYYYGLLQLKAEATPYNLTVIKRLAIFDYEGFKEEMGLNGDIFEIVKKDLIVGDIRGAYNRFYTYTGNIIEMLESIHKDLSDWMTPDKSIIWKLNQECVNMHLYGQYMAQIFYRL